MSCMTSENVLDKPDDCLSVSRPSPRNKGYGKLSPQRRRIETYLDAVQGGNSKPTHQEVADPKQVVPLSPTGVPHPALRCPLDTKSIDDLNERVLAAVMRHTIRAEQTTIVNGKIY